MNDNTDVVAPVADSNIIQSAEPFTDPFSNLTFNTKFEEIVSKQQIENQSSSSTRSASPVLHTEISESVDFDLTTNSLLNQLVQNQLKFSTNTDQSFSIPQVNLEEEEEEEASGNDVTQTDDLDSYFKNPSFTNTADMSINLNITNTEEILPTLDEIEEMQSDLLNQFDFALRNGQNFDQMYIEPVEFNDDELEPEQKQEVETKTIVIKEDEGEEDINKIDVTATTNTLSDDDSNLVSLL
jgi:hypothetical protein